jgi:hypothetical protein
LFIYVEKVPFQIFAHEPSFVSFSVFTDITYRNCRSPAGRASLESAAMQLCENYRGIIPMQIFILKTTVYASITSNNKRP